MSQVVEHGDFAVRGSLLDFYPMGSPLPVRVDFLDDEIDSLRQFDPDTQLSGAPLEALETLPAREMPVDAEAIKQFRQAYRRRFEGNPARSIIYREVSEGRMPGGVENYLPLFFDSTALLWDYLPPNRLTIALGDPAALLEPAWQQINERFQDSGRTRSARRWNPHELNGTPAEHLARLAGGPVLILDPGTPDPVASEDRAATAGLAPLPQLLLDPRAEEPTHRLREFIRSFQGRMLFAAESAGRREMLADLLRQEGVTSAEAMGWGDFLASSADRDGQHRPARPGTAPPRRRHRDHHGAGTLRRAAPGPAPAASRPGSRADPERPHRPAPRRRPSSTSTTAWAATAA